MSTTQPDALAQLHLLQLADSALPIGSTAHSFGLESLVASGDITVSSLEALLRGFLSETGLLEAAYCRAAHTLASPEHTANFVGDWVLLNAQLGALKPARESRAASATLGRRLLRLVNDIAPTPTVTCALQAAQDADVGTYHCAAFGLTGGALSIDIETTTLSYLHQSIAALISACQRLMPLGQSAAMRLLWNLKPTMIEVAERSRVASHDLASIGSFMPLIEVGSASHPTLRTRLFIS